MKRNSLKIACVFFCAMGFFSFEMLPVFAMKSSVPPRGEDGSGSKKHTAKDLAKERILRQTDPYIILGTFKPSSTETPAKALKGAQKAYNTLFPEFDSAKSSQSNKKIFTTVAERLKAALDAIQADPVNPTPIPLETST